MLWSCSYCDREFYSETEKDEHEMFEFLRQTMQRADVGWNLISSQLRVRNIIEIAKLLGCSLEQATRHYFDLGDVINKLMAEREG